jgi:hypothetical protein
MSKEHHVIIGPGMDGKIDSLKLITKKWPEKYGLFPEVVQIVWKNNEGLEPKLKKVTNLIDNFVKDGDEVSLIGCSASGSLMLNAFIERKNAINKVINLDGFLRQGNAKGYRSFKERSAKSVAFRESVLRFEKLEPMLTMEDRKKILTARPLFDELVPPETVVIKGAFNKQIPMVEHVLSIATALMAYDPVIMFLKG